MRQLGATPSERDFGKQPWRVEELERLFGDRPLEPFLNTRHEIYRSREMKNRLPTRGELIRLIVENPNLIRRPLLVAGDRVVIGFDEAGYRALVRGE